MMIGEFGHQMVRAILWCSYHRREQCLGLANKSQFERNADTASYDILAHSQAQLGRGIYYLVTQVTIHQIF